MTTTDRTSPQTIFIIRHGEKPADDTADPNADTTDSSPGPHGVTLDGVPCKHSLIPRGWQRAGGLVSLFGPRRTAPNVLVPATLICPDYTGLDSAPTSDHRPYQTLQPLCSELAGTIRAVGKGPNDHRHAVDAALKSGPRPVLLCWEHKNIPLIAREFAPGVPDVFPDRFDLIWRFDRNTDGPGYVWRQLYQDLLDGDTSGS